MPETLITLPKTDGFFMPAEFSHHTGSWMLWPQRPDNWRLGGKPAQVAFTSVATAISLFEPVTVGVNADQYGNARSMLPHSIRVVEISNNDSWIRDCGPTFLVNDGKEFRGVDWDFNAWGGLYNGLYFPWDKDDQVARKVLEMERISRYKAPFVLEGGSIHTDGEGTIMTTAECLLSPGRNPDLSQAEIDSYLCDYLGGEKVIWIPRGVFNDETTGHVDNLACFLRPGVIALTWTDDQSDPQYERSAEAYEYLLSQTDAKDREFIVHKIHQPSPIYITQEEAQGVDAVDGTLPRQAGDRLAASYINFYFCNGGALMPVFGDRYDKIAQDQLQSLLPGHQVIPIPAREILLGGGNIHCITQQQPG